MSVPLLIYGLEEVIQNIQTAQYLLKLLTNVINFRIDQRGWISLNISGVPNKPKNSLPV